MEVTVQTSDTTEVDPEDIATLLIEAGWYVHSVTVTTLPHGEGGPDRVWTDGNHE